MSAFDYYVMLENFRDKYPVISREIRERINVEMTLITSFHNGEKLQVLCNGSWQDTDHPVWGYATLRLKPADKQDYIDWSQVHPDYLSMTRNLSGNAYFHTTEIPKLCTTKWSSMHTCRVSQSSYVKGNLDWKDSLVLRKDFKK